MRQGTPQKRGRGRSGGRRGQGNGPNRTYDSNGPDVKVRGTAMTVYEKYQMLARDASSSGDRIAAESYQQHAEHYYRLMQVAKQQQSEQQAQQAQQQQGEQQPQQQQSETQTNQQKSMHAEDRGDLGPIATVTESNLSSGNLEREELPNEIISQSDHIPMNPADLAAAVEASEASDKSNGSENEKKPMRRRRTPKIVAETSEIEAEGEKENKDSDKRTPA